MLRPTVIFFTAWALLCAQTPPADLSKTDLSKKAVIEGKVTKSSGEPLPKATLHLRSATAASPAGFTPRAPSSYVVTSDANGQFLFDSVDPGRYVLLAERTGYLQQWFGARGPGGAGLSFEIGRAHV